MPKCFPFFDQLVSVTDFFMTTGNSKREQNPKLNTMPHGRKKGRNKKDHSYLGMVLDRKIGDHRLSKIKRIVCAKKGSLERKGYNRKTVGYLFL